jgi:hypothetical protein
MVVDKAFNIKIETQSIHPEYTINSEKQELIGATGLLKVFELKSSNPEKPFFWGRWDPKAQVMDIDIYNADSDIIKYFRGNKKDCGGHHPDLIDKNNRTFKVFIVISGENIFQGFVFFNINHTAHLETAHFGLTGYPVEFKIIRGPGNENLNSDKDL